MFSGWELPKIERLKLYSFIPAIYHDTFPQAIVYQFKSDRIPTTTTGDVVGSFDNQEGQQVLIFSIEGTTTRPDGRPFHLAWSRSQALIGRKPFHSKFPLIINDWRPLELPINVDLIPIVKT